jgi:TonB-linked SusC/RagA family outer membrane protein
MNFFTYRVRVVFKTTRMAGLLLNNHSGLRWPVMIQRKKVFMQIKYTVFLIMLTYMHVIADGNAQGVTLSAKNASLETIIEKITKQTGIIFWYEEGLMKETKPVNVAVRNESVSQTLDRILENQPLTYAFLKKTVILRKKDLQTDEKLQVLLRKEPEMRMGSADFRERSFRAPAVGSRSIAIAAIRGKVTTEKGDGIPGVNILVKGTQQGTVTNEQGAFSLETLTENPILVFSYIGFTTREIPVSGRTVIDVVLQERSDVLNEAVVTAMGIKREKRALGYSVGKVSGDALTETPQNNVLNALAGKVSGVQISQMSGTVGSSINIVIRGANSLNGDNQPLFVIDGVPVANQLNNGFQKADMGNPISDINPSDIENISILKGPSAAALYGSRAGNGVVLITTKSGTSQKKGIGVSFNTSTVMDFPYRYVGVQNKFGSGNNGAHLFQEGENPSWGPRLDVGEEWVQWNGKGQKAPLVSYPNRFKDFFKKGWTFTQNAAVSGNYEKGNFRLSLGNMTNSGILHNTDLSRLTIGFNSTYNLTNKLRATANVNITQSSSKNRPVIDGERTDPIRSLYEMGAQVDIRDLKDYWIPGSEGLLQNKYKEKQNNPYFVLYENMTGFKRDRTVGKIQLEYDLTDALSLQGRYTRDSYTEIDESRISVDNFEQLQGGYAVATKYRKEENIDMMISYNKSFSDVWSLSAMVGANRLLQDFQSLNNSASQLTLPGIYTINNGAPGAVTYNSFLSKKVLYGIYGSASVGYKELIYLDVTARNDWSSTFPKESRSYFYPSASLSAIVSEMVKLPSWFSFAKARAGIAQVGNDVSPYSLNQTFSTGLDWGAAKKMFMGGTMRNPLLKPEISTSMEIGADLKFLNNRISVEGTFYTQKNKNQVLAITVPIESGTGSKMINAGLVQSRGWELGVSTTPVMKGAFRWDFNLTFSRNRTYIKELADGIEYFPFVSYDGAEVRTYTGGQIGDIYMRPLLTVKDRNSAYFGYPLLTNTGLYQTDNDVSNMIKIGNFNHDVMIGIQPTFTYKAFSLYANIDWRQGGSFYSNTMMFLGNNGMLEETLSGVPYDRSIGIEEQIKANPEAYFGKWVGGRNAEFGGLPWPTENNRVQDASLNIGVRAGGKDKDGNTMYLENLGGPGSVWLIPFNAYRYSHRPFPDRNLYSATYVKLREVAVTYNLPAQLLSKVGIHKASISLVGNNLFTWTRAGNGIDPERAYRQSNAGAWVQGIEYYNVMPWTGSVGFKLNVGF